MEGRKRFQQDRAYDASLLVPPAGCRLVKAAHFRQHFFPPRCTLRVALWHSFAVEGLKVWPPFPHALLSYAQ